MNNTSWSWVQPKNQAELLARLADARDLNVPERERENLCACAHTEIKRLMVENTDLRNWRAQVTVNLRNPGGARFDEVPALITDLVAERDCLKTLPCECACHTVAGHADEPTMGMMLAEAQKEIARLKTDLGDMTANCGTLKHVTRLSAQENARLRRALTDCMQACDEWKDDSLEGGQQ